MSYIGDINVLSVVVLFPLAGFLRPLSRLTGLPLALLPPPFPLPPSLKERGFNGIDAYSLLSAGLCSKEWSSLSLPPVFMSRSPWREGDSAEVDSSSW